MKGLNTVEENVQKLLRNLPVKILSKLIECNGKRYEVSSIPSMKKMLNKDYEKQKIALKSILSPTNFACTDLLLR